MADPQWPPSHGKRHLLTEGAVRTMSVVVINELAEDRFELRAMEHKHRVEALTSCGPDEQLAERVRTGGSNGRADDPGAIGT